MREQVGDEVGNAAQATISFFAKQFRKSAR